MHVEKNNPATVNYCVIHEYSILSQKYKYGIEFKRKFLVQTCLDLYQFLAHANMHIGPWPSTRRLIINYDILAVGDSLLS